MKRGAAASQSRRGKNDTSHIEEEVLPESGNDTFHGQNNVKYVGEWKRFDGVLKRHGKGVLTTDEFVYDGNFEEDLFHGHGNIKFANNNEYTGEFHRGSLTGKGVMVFSNKSKYSGQWRDGRMHGLGTFTNYKDEKWTGMWNNGQSVCPLFPQVSPPDTAEEEDRTPPECDENLNENADGA